VKGTHQVEVSLRGGPAFEPSTKGEGRGEGQRVAGARVGVNAPSPLPSKEGRGDRHIIALLLRGREAGGEGTASASALRQIPVSA